MRKVECFHREDGSGGKNGKLGSGGVRQDHDKLLAAHAHREVLGPSEGLFERERHRPQDFVARKMAVGVIVLFEVVDIDHQDRNRLLFADRVDPFRLVIFVEVPPVAQPGQAVDIGQALEFEIGLHQGLLALAQGAIGFVALQLRKIGGRVIADPRDQLDAVGKLDEVIIRAEAERVALYRGLLLGRQHDDRDRPCVGIGAILAHEVQPTHGRHHQILQDDGRLHLPGDGDRLCGVRAVVELDLGLAEQGAPDGLGDHDLVVNEKHHDCLAGSGNGESLVHVSRC